MNRVLKSVVALSLYCASTTSYGWEFSEHRELGETSFEKACNSLIAEFKSNKDSKGLALITGIPCANVGAKARQYGIRAALSGDHIEAPHDFETKEAERNAINLVNYGTLALKNHKHFWPHVKTTWREYHNLALESAMKSRMLWDENKTTAAVTEFERALIYSAYADHFLQDAFAIGHGGFSRINSLQNPSLIFHDRWNGSGRYLKAYRFNRGPKDASLNRQVRLQELSQLPSRCDKSFIDSAEENRCYDIWLAKGDGDLKNDHENKPRIIEANVDSVKSVVLAFVNGEDTGYSLLADLQLPTATQAFVQTSTLIRRYMPFIKKQKLYSALEDDCNNEEAGFYRQFNKCWFDLENGFMEPVYPDITVGMSRVVFDGFNTSFSGVYLAYSPHSPVGSIMSHWPKSLRIYYHFNVSDTNIAYKGEDISTYRELGLNLVLPNFYEGTPISHEIDLAYAFLATDQGKYWYQGLKHVEEGGYLGFNTNFDFLKAKLTLGLGWFLASSNLDDAEFKAQLMLGWNFGVLGGGPLSRWEE